MTAAMGTWLAAQVLARCLLARRGTAPPPLGPMQLASATPDVPLSPQDRGQLIDDVFTIAEGGIDPNVTMAVRVRPCPPLSLPSARSVSLPASPPPTSQDALSFAAWLAKDSSYEAWTPAIGHLSNIRGLLFNDTGARYPPSVTLPLHSCG